MHKGLCYFVFPSFTYLTAAVLSFVVFPFYFVFISFTPAEQWIILIVSLSDLVIKSVSTVIGLIVTRLLPLAGGTTLDRGKQITPRFTESKHFQWI